MNLWDQRYSTGEFVYGTQPNDFLAEVAGRLPKGRALCLADGEGRNGVFLAEQGFEVTSVDMSRVGLEKAEKLAQERGVSLNTVVADLSEYRIQEAQWDVIVSIWCHLPHPLRRSVHAQVVAGLKPGGAFVLEAYTPKQLELKTGGPPTADLLMELKDLRVELQGLELVHAVEKERDVKEGRLHSGMSAVVQVLAFKR